MKKESKKLEDQARLQKDQKIIEEVKSKIRSFLYSQQNHSIGNGYMGWWVPSSGSYLGLLHQFVRPMDTLELDFLKIACDELVKEGDIIETKEEGEYPTRVTLTKEAIYKYFH